MEVDAEADVSRITKDRVKTLVNVDKAVECENNTESVDSNPEDEVSETVNNCHFKTSKSDILKAIQDEVGGPSETSDCTVSTLTDAKESEASDDKITESKESEVTEPIRDEATKDNISRVVKTKDDKAVKTKEDALFKANNIETAENEDIGTNADIGEAAVTEASQIVQAESSEPSESTVFETTENVASEDNISGEDKTKESTVFKAEVIVKMKPETAVLKEDQSSKDKDRMESHKEASGMPISDFEEDIDPKENTATEMKDTGAEEKFIEAEISEPMEVEETELNKAEAAHETAKAGPSKITESGSSYGDPEEDDENDNEQRLYNNTSLLDEESERLDQLDIPANITPEPCLSETMVVEEEREKQYKNLVELLSKSKFYTDVLLKKVEAEVEESSGRKRKHPDSGKNTPLKQENNGLSPSKQSSMSPTKRKKILMENQRTMYHIASDVMKNKNVEKTNGPDADTVASDTTETAKSVNQIKQPVLLSGGNLRDYQLDGFNWLKVLYENGVNGILADEMGLGKTIQVIALLAHLVEMKIKGPFLIVAPLSTLPNWMIEFKRFAPQLHVVLFYGSQVERRKMYGTLMNRKTVKGVSCYPIIVTSYEVPVFERAFMGRFKWKYIIVDEGHRIKNYNTVLAKVLRSFESANRLLLTGTPLHNSLSELWSLLNFLVPEIFDNLEVFESWFRIEELTDDAGRKRILEEERRKNILSTLHQILGPFMLRRIKAEVTLEIPKKKEVIVKAPMTEVQLKLYQALLDRNIAYLKRKKTESLIIPEVDGKRPKRSCTLGKVYVEKDDDSFSDESNDAPIDKENDLVSIIKHHIRVKLQVPHVALKQIANHPYLLHYPLKEDGRVLIDDNVIRTSGKFLVLDALLQKLHARGHKVLVFSTLCMLLNIVEDYLSLRPYSYERLDGSVKIDERADSIQRFNTDPNIFLFLLSTRAGGLGVNLTGADTVIFLDSDWNPQADLQAQDRCHRIGQTKPVMIYRLVTSGTIEEQILSRAGAKRVLEKLVISKGTCTQRDFDLEELKSILESKDHSEIVYTDGQVLSDEQLEKLLDRSDLMN